MRHTFETEQWLPLAVETVFAFFADPRNLPRLMPAWQRARIEEASYTAPTAPPASGAAPSLASGAARRLAAGAGSRMTLSFRPFPYSPLRIPWEAEIVEFAWNDHFCDLQLRGPFAFWRHCHRLTPETRDHVAGTLLRDQLEYEMRLGWLGELAHAVMARRQVEKIFQYRQQRTAELLEPGRG